MRQLDWTLVALLSLGGVAAADSGGMPDSPGMATEAVGVERSHRGVAQDYLVLPSGGELTAQMRFVTADAMLQGQKLEFSDLGVFGVSGRWSLFTKLELSASVDFLAKQPSFTDEKPWQSVGFALRSPLGRHIALAVGGGGGHLMNHQGMWTGESFTLEFKKPIDDDFLAFDVQAGMSGLGLSSPDTTQSTAFLTEMSLRTTALFHDPHGHVGGWIGIGYSVPVQFRGKDPTTEMEIDPQPRLGFHAGAVLSPVKQWDLFVDFAIVDRGDEENPATQLPVLDGGFDQQQVIFGITRHIEGGRQRTYDDDGGDGMVLGSL
jgi:hypothetical protein